jgi:hypothetical protein
MCDDFSGEIRSLTDKKSKEQPQETISMPSGGGIRKMWTWTLDVWTTYYSSHSTAWELLFFSTSSS